MVIHKTKGLTAVLGGLVLFLSSFSTQALIAISGEDGWELSFDGTINAFYIYSEAKGPVEDESSRIQSGYLPSEFSFNVQAPEFNGVKTTGRISFRPTLSNSKVHTQAYSGPNGALQGSSIETREVFFNVSSDAYGTLSFGRTLSIFGRQAIVRDQTLFGVGRQQPSGGNNNYFDSAIVSIGRVGAGYVYPNFETRVSYKTPSFYGVTLEVGLYDPSEPQLGLAGAGQNMTITTQTRVGTASLQHTTKTPRIEAELLSVLNHRYGYIHSWLDGTYQQIESTVAFTNNLSRQVLAGTEKYAAYGAGVGLETGFDVFQRDKIILTGYLYGGRGIGTALQFQSDSFVVGLNPARTALEVEGAAHYGGYGQLAYVFNNTTKIAGSWGSSRQTDDSQTVPISQANINAIATSLSNTANGLFGNSSGRGILDDVTTTPSIDRNMWVIGVYHDVTSWMKVVAEYSQLTEKMGIARGFGQAQVAELDDLKVKTFSVGTSFWW